MYVDDVEIVSKNTASVSKRLEAAGYDFVLVVKDSGRIYQDSECH